ncbi:hypothetical protein STSO111631_04585 [Stackebrandtia soli]
MPGGLPPAPQKSNTGLFIRLGIAAVVVIAIVIVATTTNLFNNDPKPDVGDTSNTTVAEVGSCTDESMIANQIKVVNCEDTNAVYRVTARSDEPGGTDAEAEETAKTVCAGTPAVTFLYQYDQTSRSLDWMICLEPADGSNLLNYGELPKAGDCISSTRQYPNVVDCNAADADEEVIASGTPDASQTDDQAAAIGVCGESGWEYYYIGPDQATPPWEWVYCTMTK